MKYLSVTILCLISTVVYGQYYYHLLGTSVPLEDRTSGLESIKRYGTFVHPATQPSKDMDRIMIEEKNIKNFNLVQKQDLQQEQFC